MMGNSWLVSPDQSPGLGIAPPLAPSGEGIIQSGQPLQTAENIRAGASGKNFQPSPIVPDRFSTDLPGALPAHGAAIAPLSPDTDHDAFIKHFVERNMQLEGEGKDPNSSAVGGFIDSTWMNLMRKTHPETAQMPPDRVLGLRNDPQLRRQMWAVYAGENAQFLQQNGIPANGTTLRLANWFGPDGARRVLSSDPSTPMKDIFSPQVIAANGLAGRTVGQVVEQTQQQMSGADLKTVWNTPVPELTEEQRKTLGPELSTLWDLQRNQAQQQVGAQSALLQQYMKAANEAEPGSKERERALASLREEAFADRQKFRELISHPPVEKPVDAFANFGSLASVVGLLGGLLTRQHITGALNAAGSAMEAINTNNHQQFEQSFKSWQNQAELSHTLFQMENEEIRDLMADKRISVDEKNTRLANLATEMGFITNIGKAAGTPIETMGEVLKSRITSQNNMNNVLKQMQISAATAQIASDNAAHPEWTEAERTANAKKILDGVGKTEKPVSESAGREQEVEKAVKSADDAFKAAHPAATAAEIAAEHTKNDLAARTKMALANARSATGELGADTVKLLAQQYEMGDPGVITALPRSGPARIQVENQVAKDLKDMPDGAAQIVMNRLRMAEARSAATTAGRVTMNTALFAQEAIGAGQQVVETSKLFPRTELPLVNAALAAYERNTGDPNIIKFGAALNSLINAYGKMSNPTGTGVHDADKARIEKIMDTAFSQGQIEAGVQQIVTEGQVMSQAAQQAQSEVLRQAMPTIPGSAPASTSAAPSVAPPQQTAPKEVIQNGWRYDATTHQPLGPVQ